MSFAQFVQCLSTILLCVLSWIAVLLLLTIVIPVFCILIPYKWFVNLIVSWRHPGSIPLTGMDIGCAVYMDLYKKEGKMLSNLGTTFVVDADVEIEDLRTTVQDKLLNLLVDEKDRNDNRKYKYDRLRRYPVKFMWHYYWSREVLDLDVKTVVKERRTKATDLEAYINKWLHMGYKDGCPIWEIMVYKDEDEYKGKSVIAIKMSHALGDGYSIRTLGAVFVGSQAPMCAKESLLSTTQGWLHPKEMLIFISMGPYLLLKFLADNLLHSDLLSESNKLAETELGFTTIRLDTVKTIRRANDCKFNDVLLALFGNAIRRFLLEMIPENKLPEIIKFACAREVPNRPAEICNHLTQQMFPVPIANPDRHEKLVKLKAATKDVFQYSTYKLIYYCSGLPYYFPTFFFKSSDSVKHGISCALSPIPEVPDSQYFGTYPVLNFYGLAGQQSKQLVFFGTTVTRGAFLDVTLLGNRGVFQNPAAMARLKTYVHEELQFLLNTIEGLKNNETRRISILMPETFPQT